MRLCRLHTSLCRLHTGARGLGGGEVLGDLLGTQRTAGLDRLCPIGIGLRLGRRGLGLGQPGTGLGQRRISTGQIGPHGVGGKDREDLSALDRRADISPHFGNPQTIDLGTDRGLLPGKDAAVGRQRVGNVALVGAHGVDHQCRTIDRRRCRRGSPGCCRDKERKTERRTDEANEHADEHRRADHSDCGRRCWGSGSQRPVRCGVDRGEGHRASIPCEVVHPPPSAR